MKKLIVILFIFLMASVSWAGEAIISSGLTTSDRSITSRPGYFYGCILISSESTASVIIYDGTTIVTGKEIFKAEVGLTNKCPPPFPPAPIEYFTGIYADVTGTGSNYIIYFKPR